MQIVSFILKWTFWSFWNNWRVFVSEKKNLEFATLLYDLYGKYVQPNICWVEHIYHIDHMFLSACFIDARCYSKKTTKALYQQNIYFIFCLRMSVSWCLLIWTHYLAPLSSSISPSTALRYLMQAGFCIMVLQNWRIYICVWFVSVLLH